MEYRKIAFFVEGYTEQQFVKKLLTEIFGKKSLGIEVKEVKGGKKVAISYTTIETPEVTDDTKFYVLIYNCNGDGKIKSYILDHRVNLIKAGYEKVIGLRDLFPDFTREEIHDLITGLNYKLPQKDLPIKFVLSIMEIESWFLAEENHFINIDSDLTLEHINEKFGFDFKSHNTELIDEAAETLKQIYCSVGKTYKKEAEYIDRTINAMDFTNVYFNVQKRIASLKNLIEEFEEVFE